MFEYTVTARDTGSKARSGEFVTPHGILQTPALAIVGTEGQIRSIPPDIAKKLPLNYTIVNTFHIWTKGILEKITNFPPSVHTYGGFPGVVASDSGGFQVFSLGFGKAHNVGKVANIFPGEATGILNKKVPEGEAIHLENLISDKNNPVTITEDGVTFRWNDQDITLNPELSMELQDQIGSDIHFAFDECTSPFNTKEYTARSMGRTHRWLDRCIARHKTLSGGLFAILQGGEYPDLRIQAAKHCGGQDVPGFGLGGSWGKEKKTMYQLIECLIPYLPDEKPRHLLGIGQVTDLFEGVERGVDLFDCVIPTREARHKVIYTIKGKVVTKKLKTLQEPIAIDCNCIACHQKITWAQLHELFVKRDPRAYFFATVHNIQFFADLMEEIGESIENHKFNMIKDRYLSVYS